MTFDTDRCSDIDRCSGTTGLPRLRSAVCMLLLVAAVLTLAGGTRADAHDVLIGTNPSDGSVVRLLPSTVTVTFSEPVLAVGTAMRVTSPVGVASVGPLSISGNTISQAIKPDGPEGLYTALWRATSADGHPVSGGFSFTVSADGKAKATPIAGAPSAAASGGTSGVSSGSGTSDASGIATIGSPLMVGLLVVLAGLVLAGWATRRGRRNKGPSS